MSQSATIGGIWGDFIAIFWITKYLQRPINVGNIDSNRIMCKCGLDYQMDTLHIACSNQHFEPIESTCDIRNTQLQFETQNFQSFINLDDHTILSKPIK
jgi:hypothetical protein